MRKPRAPETNPFDNDSIDASKACSALQKQIGHLYVPHIFTEYYGFTQVHTRRPNPRIRGLVNVGTEHNPAIHAVHRDATLYQQDRFTAVIRPADARTGMYRALTSLAEIDFDIPVVEGYALRLHPATSLMNPTDFTPERLYEALWEASDPSGGKVGHVGFDTAPTGAGPELAATLADELAEFTSRRTLGGMVAAATHWVFAGGEA